MQTLKEQQAKAWQLAPDDAKWVAQDDCGGFHANTETERPLRNSRYGWYSPKSGWEYIYRGEINGWDWRNTLQARKEWEAMNKPETEIDKVNNDIRLYGQGFMQNGKHIPFKDVVIYQDTIQTQADKYRDEQIERITKVLTSNFGDPDVEFNTFKQEAEVLVDKGVRVLAPDEFVAKRLTDEQVDFICKSYNPIHHKAVRDAIDAVQNAMLGEEK